MDQQFSLTWNNFHGNLTKGFAGLLGSGEFVDVTIAVDGHLLQAHKVILSICSPYFKKMFQINPCQHPIVVLRDVSHKAMKDLLQFMYHGEVSVKREDLTTFIGTAELLEIKGLTNKETEEEENNKETEDTCTTSNQNRNKETDGNDTLEVARNEIAHTNELLRQREFIEKLHRFSNLKRKSEEFLQSNYYSDVISEKRSKIKDKYHYTKPNNHMPQNSGYETSTKFYNDNLTDTASYVPTNLVMDSKEPLKEPEEKQNDSVELKTEIEDLDVSVSDPGGCTTPKDYDGSKEDKNELSLPLDYQSPQDNTPCVGSLFMDLKNIVNSKVPVFNNTVEDYQGLNMGHRLITIPQKEDGKKKYPQRSCRLCWKIGRRRDTRFMCNSCELPFCKTPCFDFHINEIRKMSQFQNEFYS